MTCQGAYDRGLQATTPDVSARSTTLAVAPPNVEPLAAGRGFTCARLSTGEVDCWGSDDDGQLGAAQAGDDADATRLTPLPVVGITDAVDLAAGESHACAVRADGSAWCWGSDADGDLGDGASAPMGATPVRVAAVQQATAIAAGDDFTCAIAGDSGLPAVWCWGNDAHHQLGGATATAPIAAVADPVRIAAGNAHACAIERDGTTLCWGTNANGEITGSAAGAAATLPPTRVPPP